MKKPGLIISEEEPDKVLPGRTLLLTKDGSHTIEVPSLDITYRSRHGARQESIHVFIDAGLKYKWENRSPESGGVLHIFELGFGTGLNALLTSNEALAGQQKIVYTAIEPYPLDQALIAGLNYEDHEGYLEKMHSTDWNSWVTIHPFFEFIKIRSTLEELNPENIPVNPGQAGTGIETSASNDHASFDLVYFDAFGPLTQPELWSAETFSKVASLMKSGAVLTTYCSKSVVRKTMTSSGLHVTKVPGPYGKREMVRAFKP